MIGEALPMARGIGVASADIPQAVRPEPVDRHEGDFARLGGLRDVEHSQPRGEFLFAAGEGLGNRGLEVIVGVGIALQHPDVRRVDRQQQIAVGLQMKGARIRRRRNEVDWARLLWVAHIDDREAVAEHVADKGMPLVHHDLHAIAATVQIGVGDKLDVARGFRFHGMASLAVRCHWKACRRARVNALDAGRRRT
jgi:hypothetical protein